MTKKNSAKMQKNQNLFQLYANGDLKARQSLIIQNMSLVHWIVFQHFNFCQTYDDIDDFISIGTIGLIKAIDSFDQKKNCSFKTYATKVIYNEILMHLRKWKKWNSHLSLQQPISGENLTLEDVICDEKDFIDDILMQLDFNEAFSLLSNLSDREQEILKYYLGFYPPKLTQAEISLKFNLSQSYVSRIVKNAIFKLQQEYTFNTRKKSQSI